LPSVEYTPIKVKKRIAPVNVIAKNLFGVVDNAFEATTGIVSEPTSAVSLAGLPVAVEMACGQVIVP
jgi:hypothetical protein